MGVVPAVLVVLGLFVAAFIAGRGSTTASAAFSKVVELHPANSAETFEEIFTWAPGWAGQSAHGGDFAVAAAQAVAALSKCAGTTAGVAAGDCTASATDELAEPCKCGSPKRTCQKGSKCGGSGSATTAGRHCE